MDTDKQALRIMAVDDTSANLKLLNDLLTARGYRVQAFPGAEMALKAARHNPPHLFLLDVNMPGMNGYELCLVLKNDPRLQDIPVIFISALDEVLDKVKAFKMGAVDYVNKPFQIDELLARVETHMRLHLVQQELEEVNQQLAMRVQEQVKEIAESQMATIMALANLAESRDDDTGTHLLRVQAIAFRLAARLAEEPVYADIISKEFENNLYYASALHDIGKVGIADSILLKPGKLTVEEFEIMKSHTLIGARTLESVLERYKRNSFVAMGIEVARFHHERWDGRGYPDGLRGEEIPLSARIMALVDVYDALRSDRCYKKAMSQEEAREIIVAGRGSQFAPDIVDAFLEIEGELTDIMEEYS